MVRQILVGVLLLVPMAFSVLLPLAPIPIELSTSKQVIFSASMTNNTVAEIEALQTMLDYAPWMGKSWQKLGRLQLDLEKYDEAITAFHHAQSVNQLTNEGMLWMADALLSSGNVSEAQNLLRKFSQLDEVDPFVFLQAALLQTSMNDTYGALATLLKGYEIDPQNGEINFEIGLHFLVSEPDKALPFLQRASELNPSNAPLCQVLISVIEQFVSTGENGDLYLAIGQTLSSYEEWEAAQRVFQKATEINSGKGQAWAFLAEALQQSGKDSKEYILKAQELAPEDEMVNGLSGLYYRRQGNSELAITYLQKALEVNPDAVVWKIEIANTIADMGDLASALEVYQAAVKIDSQNWVPWRALAVFCVTYDYEVAETGISAAQQALELYEGSPALMDLLGTAYLMNENLQEAENYFLQADAIDPHQTAILIHLGQVYLAMGDDEKGIEYLRQAVEYATDKRLLETAEWILSENGYGG